MKIFMRLVFVSILMIVAAPSYSASVVHVFSCEQDEEATRKDLEAVATKWLKAAKTQKGGDQLEAYLNFPRAAQMGEKDFSFILLAPSFAEWGVFIDGYEGSAAAQNIDNEWDELADCPDSSLWESVAIKVE